MKRLKARYFLLGPPNEEPLLEDVIGANKYHAGIYYKGLHIDIDRQANWHISFGFYERQYLCIFGVPWLLGVQLNDHQWQIGHWNGRWFWR